MTTATKLDRATAAWVRNASDEKAVIAGCRFDVDRASYVVWWIERFCRLYEGDQAGEPLTLNGCHKCGTYGLPAATEFAEWDDAAKKAFRTRATKFAKCVAAGHFIDWQYECIMRLFGWVRHSEKWGREIRRFRQASIFVAKKNKKSPTLAAIGLYLTVGDGEPGAKSFFGAKDGNQARKIAGEHSQKMIEKSPELSSEFKINQTTLRMSHLPSDSYLEPMMSANAQTQKSAEGKNGNMLIDEVHVVDREFIGRISRAGISRSEPLHLEVSTAGNDPDSYGFERFQYAANVENGTFEDQALFVAIYAAPQAVTDADLDADPLKYARMANPAMGHTVDPEELLADYKSSRGNMVKLSECKMYRFNIWQKSSNPWLKASDWAKCRRQYTEDDLLGRECYAGLDLSKTYDMSSLVLVFPEPEPETYKLLAYFWLPEEMARENNGKVPFLQWAKDGWLEMTPGNVIDYGFIRAKFRKLAAKFQIRELAYDQKYAEETTQALEQGVMDDQGEEIEAGTGVTRYVFPQTLMEFAGPCKDFERFVVAGTLHNDGNPIMAWQAGHVQVKSDANQNFRPVKPPKNDLKKIDGIVGGIMGLARAALGVAEESSITVW